MPRIQPVDVATAQGQARETFASIQGALGGVPAMFRTLGHAPATLQALWGVFGAMGTSTLPPSLREQIALAVGQTNGCTYCVNAHTALGKKAGLADTDLLDARRGNAADAKARAGLRFALAVLERKGHVSDADIAAARSAGYTEGEVLDIVGVVVQNVFTNWINHVADTPLDFPAAPALR